MADKNLPGLEMAQGLSQGLLKLAEILSAPDAETLWQRIQAMEGSGPRVLMGTSEFIVRAADFISTQRMVIEEAKLTALFDAYNEIAVMLRDAAHALETGRKMALTPAGALRQVATSLEESAKATRRALGKPGGEPATRPAKPKLIIH